MSLFLASPAMLAAGLLVPIALWLRHRRGAAHVRLGAASLLCGMPATWRTRLRFLPTAVTVLGLLAAVVALARPVRQVPAPLTTEGIDVMLCLDTSSSMAANDMDPERTRLDMAKEEAAHFVTGRGDDRVGLVTFARYPDLRSPLTADQVALGRIISGVELVQNDGPEDATGIGTALTRAVQVLAAGESKSKVVILLTDGEENVSTTDTEEEIAPLHAAQLAERLGIRVHAISAGKGTPGRDGRLAPLDTRQVEAVARRTGGKFFRARDAGGMAAVYAEIDALTKVVFSEPRYETEERFVPFLVIALLLLLIGRLLAYGPLAVLA